MKLELPICPWFNSFRYQLVFVVDNAGWANHTYSSTASKVAWIVPEELLRTLFASPDWIVVVISDAVNSLEPFPQKNG
jgi:hypothetical protein